MIMIIADLRGAVCAIGKDMAAMQSAARSEAALSRCAFSTRARQAGGMGTEPHKTAASAGLPSLAGCAPLPPQFCSHDTFCIWPSPRTITVHTAVVDLK